jgi:hypothetical protein
MTKIKTATVPNAGIRATTLRVNALRDGKVITSRYFDPSFAKLADDHARHIAGLGFVAEIVTRHYPARG